MTYESASSALMFLSAPIVFQPITVVAEGPGSQTPLVVLGTEHVGRTAVWEKNKINKKKIKKEKGGGGGADRATLPRAV